MKSIFLSGIAALALTACATGPTAYGPATGPGKTGFYATQLQSDRFRVSFTGRGEYEARDYALLRAAEITLAEGYSHFRVISEDIYGNGGGSPVSSSVGVGVGSGGYRRGSRTNVGVGVGVADLGRALQGDQVTSTLMIKLQNTGGTTPDIFDARSVTQSIRPRNFTP